jgi:uncharacterized protein (DUF1810 family)
MMVLIDMAPEGRPWLRELRRGVRAPDDMKFRPSMTLFARAALGKAIFRDALDQYFSGAEVSDGSEGSDDRMLG